MNRVPAREVPLEAFVASKNLVSRYLCIQPKFARDLSRAKNVKNACTGWYCTLQEEKKKKKTRKSPA